MWAHLLKMLSANKVFPAQMLKVLSALTEIHTHCNSIAIILHFWAVLHTETLNNKGPSGNTSSSFRFLFEKKEGGDSDLLETLKLRKNLRKTGGWGREV